jgi:hypothetical protein
MLNRQQCVATNPCSGLSGTDNGCLTSLKSGQVGNNKYTLLADAGVALEKMYDDMPEDVKKDLKISDSYRPLKTQCSIFDFDIFEKSGKRVKKGTSGTPVARPGTSNHGWGRALDLSKKKAQDWIRENGSKYGWCWGEVKSEPWHFTFCGSGPNRSDLCNTICKDKIDPSLASGSGSSSSSQTPTSDTEKKGGIDMLDMLGGSGLKSWLDTFMPVKKDGEQKPKEEPINEEVDRIKELIKKVL